MPYTIKLIIDHYPLESITDLHPAIYIPGLKSVWHEKFFTIGDQEFCLDRIEHEILRPEFEDARIHFAINCASMSCPVLRNVAYEPEDLDEALDEQAALFINDDERNKISRSGLEVSKIFSWFREDFEREGDLIDYLNRYSDVKIDKDAKVRFLTYDWSLNER